MAVVAREAEANLPVGEYRAPATSELGMSAPNLGVRTPASRGVPRGVAVRRPKEARDRIRADKVAAAILDESEEWIASPELQKRAAAKAKTSTRTVLRRLPELVSDRFLAVRGTGQKAEYRRTGLI